MTVLVIVGLVFLAMGAWIVRTAGWAFTARRVGQAVLVVLVVTFGTTWLLRQFPGGTDAPCILSLGTGATPEAVAECVDDRKLDESVIVQYVDWGGEVLRGDLGYATYRTQFPLSEVLSTRLPRTIALFIYSQAIALAIAVPMGIWAAYQAGKPPSGRLPRWTLPAGIVGLGVVGLVLGWGVLIAAIVAALVPIYVYNFVQGGAGGDKVVNIQSFVLLSIPVFVMGETLRYWFAIRWSWYDIEGYKGPNQGIAEHLGSMWLPSLVLALAVTPVYLRLLRADMIQNLQQDFVAVAKAKGLPNWWILIRHVLRPSSLTLLTVAGLNIAQLVNGAIVVEFIYDLDGMGSWLIDAVLSREFLPVQTVVALVAVLFVVVNTLIDLFYTTVDPRVRVGESK